MTQIWQRCIIDGHSLPQKASIIPHVSEKVTSCRSLIERGEGAEEIFGLVVSPPIPLITISAVKSSQELLLSLEVMRDQVVGNEIELLLTCYGSQNPGGAKLGCDGGERFTIESIQTVGEGRVIVPIRIVGPELKGAGRAEAVN